MSASILNDLLNDFSEYKEEIETIIYEADNILKGNFVFNNVWDMEVCDELVSNPQLNWNINFKGDLEWAFMFVRFDYSYKLIIAYEITKDLKFIKFGLEFIKKWYEDNKKFLPKYLGKIANKIYKGHNTSHRTLDLAIFSCNATDFIIYCQKNSLISDRTFKEITNIITKICKYVSFYDSEFKLNSNWGIMENAYSLYSILTLKLKIPSDIFNNRLVSQLKLQIREDGSQIESSPMYLVEIILALFKCIQISSRVEVDEVSLIYEKTKLACEYIYYITSPDGCIPNIGDSDKVDVSDLMIIASSIFKDEKFLNKCSRNVKIEYLYKYSVCPINRPVIMNRHSFRSHLFKYQSLVADKDIWLLCNNIPYGPSGHKHYDFLSVLLFINNKEFLIDGGRATYKNTLERKLNKGANSHSSVKIDGDKYWKYKDSWITENSIYIKNDLQTIQYEGVHNIKMECQLGLKNSILRSVIYIPRIGVIILDIISGEEINTYEAFFPLSPLVEIATVDNGYKLQIDETDIYYLTSSDDVSIKDITCSRRYNTSIKTKEISASSINKKNFHCFLFNMADVDVKILDDKVIVVYENTIISGKYVMKL